jgi:hypothetical protein
MAEIVTTVQLVGDAGRSGQSAAIFSAWSGWW